MILLRLRGSCSLRWRCGGWRRLLGLSSVPLRLVQFETQHRMRVGVELSNGGDIVDVTAVDKSIPSDMRTLLGRGQDVLQSITRAACREDCVLRRDSVRLCAPIHNPEKVICVGMNYTDHCAELDLPVPEAPVIFSKFASSITGPTADIPFPPETQELDFEAELAVIMGRSGRRLSEEEAMSYVAGFTVAHDVSARDWQLKKNSGQWLLGKTFDSFCPLGPALVTVAALSDPHQLGIRCRVNNFVMQDSNTDQLVHKTPAIVAFVSRFVTLQPGDVILTGTPPGVGCFRKPPVWLKKGDIVECEIDEIGCIRNTII